MVGWRCQPTMPVFSHRLRHHRPHKQSQPSFPRIIRRMTIKPGQTVGQYIIQDKLGEGGMGAVYKAEQPAIHRSVALKVLSANFANDPDALGRFKREVDIIAEL